MNRFSSFHTSGFLVSSTFTVSAVWSVAAAGEASAWVEGREAYHNLERTSTPYCIE